MIKWTIKKSFFDSFDNTLLILLPNGCVSFVVAAAAVGLVFLSKSFSRGVHSDTIILLIGFLILLVATIIISIIIVAWGDVAKKISSGESVSAGDFLFALPCAIKDGVLFSLTELFSIALFCALAYIIKPRGEEGVFFRYALFILVFWIMTIVFQSILFFPALRANQKNSYPKAIKKCFIILLDNILPATVIMFYNILVGVLSLITLGLIGGAGTLVLNRCELIHNILKKYDYIEAAKEKGFTDIEIFSRPIPWEKLLESDIARYPRRTLSSFIVPK